MARHCLTFAMNSMHKASITASVLMIVGAIAAACSTASDPEKPLPLGDGDSDGGNTGRDAANPLPDAGAESDADIEDARDELIPIDADRGGDSGDGDSGDGGGEADAPIEPACIFDEDCADQITSGVCEIPKCKAGACGKEFAPRGFPCDDGIECSSGGLCEEGVCTPGQPDVTNPDCAENATRNALWITEIMGRPQPIDGSVDATEGQWVEITSRASKELHLQGIRLVYYEWPDGEAEPGMPSYSAYLFGDASVSPGDTLLVARSSESSLNGGLRASFAYGEAFELRGDRNARLVLVTPEWTKGVDLPLGELPPGPIDEQYIIDSVLIPAGTFGDADRGRSWQVSEPLPPPTEERTWCYAPADSASAYVEEGGVKNYGTPGRSNLGCP